MTVANFYHYSTRRCAGRECSCDAFICRVNRFGVRLALCENHWRIVEMALDPVAKGFWK